MPSNRQPIQSIYMYYLSHQSIYEPTNSKKSTGHAPFQRGNVLPRSPTGAWVSGPRVAQTAEASDWGSARRDSLRRLIGHVFHIPERRGWSTGQTPPCQTLRARRAAQTRSLRATTGLSSRPPPPHAQAAPSTYLTNL